MKKYFLITTLFIASTFNAISQSISERKDSLKIVSIKKELPKLKGIDRIDKMILLVEYYSDKIKYRNMNALDSIRKYGSKISNESKAIGYKKGIAMGILTTAPDSLREIKALEMIQTGDENGEEVLGWAYSTLIRDMSPMAIKNYQQAIDHFNKAGKILRAAYINNWLCQIYLSSGENEKAFDCARKNIAIIKTIHDPEFSYIYYQCLLWNYWNMNEISSAAGDYGEALKYIQKTNEVDKANDATADSWDLDISGIYAELGNYDSALFYWNRTVNTTHWKDPNWGWRPGRKFVYNYRARIYTMNKQYDEAIKILKDNIVYFDSLLKHTTGNYQNAGNYGKMYASLLLGKIYDSLKQYKTSLQYAKDGYYYAEVKGRRPEMMQACQLLSNAYHHLNNNDSAYSYLSKYVILKDSIQSKQFLLRIYNSKKEAEDAKTESRLGFLNKDNKIKEQQLKQQAIIKNFLIAVFISFVLIGVFVYRNLRLKRKNEMMWRERAEDELKLQQLENEKKQSELKQQAAELEMQALRAQMNPHFIFNCLSSINKFILKNETEAASDYLTRFSRLIRMVLINSQKSLITLEDELEMLRLYLDMERLRFKNSFEYNILFKNTVDAGAIYLPPLLLQPFCENAIWHGLMHKEGQGVLDIAMTMQDNILNCTITDNGVGREMAAELNSKSAEKEKSLGLKITAGRLELLNRNNGAQTSYTIEDLYDEKRNAAGTMVTVQIKYKNSIEEFISN